jgi:hypothetical protein
MTLLQTWAIVLQVQVTYQVRYQDDRLGYSCVVVACRL